ncbi:MAG: sugar phosphate isomerase/epimerase [Dysgonamonadaceae bacterium]|jgi:inosose dehydratase|nr:sugar phosphate isomerase/epimerase [Dysgonamonadaceae bacterium]
MNRRQFIKNAAVTSMVIAGGLNPSTGVAKKKPEKNIRWSMGWILWRDFKKQEIPITEAISNLSDLGLDGIEFTPRKDELSKFGLTREQFRDLLVEKKLLVSGNYFGLGKDCFENDKRNATLASFKETLENLKFYGAKDVVIGPPGRVEGSINEMVGKMAPLVNELGKIATDMDMRIGIHPHVNTIVEKPEEIDLIMELTDPKYVHMAPDTGHIFLGGGDVIEIIRKYRKRLSYFHLKDASGTFNRPDFGPNLRELGKGAIDFASVMKILKANKFSGWLNVEQDTTFSSPLQSATESMNYIDGTLKPIYT